MAAGDNVIGCGKAFELMELFSGAIGVDATGHAYVRLVTTTNVAGSKLFSCATAGGDPTNIAAGILGIFALDANGDWAVRTGTAT